MQIEQDNYEQNNVDKSKKITTAIGIALTVLVVAIIAVIVLIISLTGNKLTVVIDGVAVKAPEDTFIFSEDGKVYVSIKDVAPLVGYSFHNGEYKVNVENDTNKMYVECPDETASFYYNSQTISKVAPSSNNDYENIAISEPVVRMNDKLYVISDGFVTGFNSTFNYDANKNRITIQTLPSLVAAYSEIIADYDFAKISEEFNNQKALISGLLVASREDGKFGVKTTSGTEVISPRYNQIEYVESAKEFIITNSSNKVGIAYNTGKTKITVSYDDIRVIDSTLGLYLVKSNNKYGIINSEENFIVHIEYEQIGVDTSNFPADNIKNQYILCGNIIPVKYNNKWRLLDVNGKRLNNDEYDEIGFINKTIKNKIINNALEIGSTNTIVVGKLKEGSTNYSQEKVYGGVDVKGNVLVPISFDAIYSITSSGVTTYYILSNEKEYNATDLINAMKLRMGYTQDEIEKKEEQGTQPQGATETVDSNTVSNENVISAGETNTVETSVEPTEINGIMKATNITSNNIEKSPSNIVQSATNSTEAYNVVTGE